MVQEAGLHTSGQGRNAGPPLEALCRRRGPSQVDHAKEEARDHTRRGDGDLIHQRMLPRSEPGLRAGQEGRGRTRRQGGVSGDQHVR